MSAHIRPARPSDATAMARIYSAGIASREATFEARGQGLGTTLLTALVDAATAAGLGKLIGRLFTSNAASLALARRCGFRDVGVHHRHGRLDGEWRDVLVVERLLGEAADDAP